MGAGGGAGAAVTEVSGGETAIAVVSDGAAGGRGSGGSTTATIAGASGASSGERVTHAPTPAADATTMANDATTMGRFSREGAAAGLPVIPEE